MITTGDEIEDLAEELNQMNVQLQASFSGLVTEVETKTQEVEYLRESTIQILDGIPDPVIMVDEHFDVQYMNLALSMRWGGPRAGVTHQICGKCLLLTRTSNNSSASKSGVC